MNTRAVFELERVSYRYNKGVMAVCEVDLWIRQGERVAILGGTRSGKSTLLKILQGRLAAITGIVKIFDQNLPLSKREKFGKFQSRIGFSGQHPDDQLFRPTVLDDLIYGGRVVDVPSATSRTDFQQICDILEIEDLLDRSSAELSSGEKKIVSIAAALLGHPEVFILDDPTPGLSEYFKQRIVWLLTASAFAPSTLLLSTQDLALAASLCERAILLSPDHRKVADGPTQRILHDVDLLVSNKVIHVIVAQEQVSYPFPPVSTEGDLEISLEESRLKSVGSLRPGW